MDYKRQLTIQLPPGQSAFLWGARQTGKSTFLTQHFPHSIRYDLLHTDLYLALLKEPSRLREELLREPPERLRSPIIIDEVQRVPLLLDEVHWLIENRKLGFVLCGSSARKLKRGGGNLLGGRAWSFEMYPLVFPEIPDFDLLRAMNQGLLPPHYLSASPGRSLKAYVNDYLTEEIKAEGLVRNLAAFSRFLEAAAFSHGHLVQFSNIASDCGVDAKTVKEYFEILKDTYIGSFLMPLKKKTGRKTITETPKFYFFDAGVANYLSKVKLGQMRGMEAGRSFESYLHHEICAYRSYHEKDFVLNYWQTSTGLEVDFVVNKDQVYIEAKISDHIKSSELKGLRALMSERSCQKAYVVCCEKRSRVMTTPEGHRVAILPWAVFLKELWGGAVV